MDKGLNAALLEAQKKIAAAIMDAKNPHYKNDYATLRAVIEAVKAPLNDAGIMVVQPLVYWSPSEAGEGKWCIETRLVHVATGETLVSRMPIVAKDMNDPQKWGSAITYARRYTLQSVATLPSAKSEEDDGNKAADVDGTDKEAEARYKAKEEKQMAALLQEAKKELDDLRKAKKMTVEALKDYALQQTGREIGQLDAVEIKTLTAKLEAWTESKTGEDLI